MMSWNKLILGVFLLIPSSWTRVSRLNAAIDKASETYAKADYPESVKDHLVLFEEFQQNSTELDFNLGLSHHYADRQEEAVSFYDKASTSQDKILSSFAYNQGGVLIGTKKEYEAALLKFQSALIKDPQNEVARYNYEMLARWMQRDKERKENDKDKPEPSEFAKRKKAEADRLVEQFKFNEALKLMNEALQQDQTVAAYQEFITSLTDIAQILNEK
jgi:tetratricopeptide (TPR) repeat protein